MLLTTVCVLGACCQLHAADYVVKEQMSGPYVNSYLLYDPDSKTAAIFDVGGPIDSLLTVISDNGLKLKYIFLTHGHIDHVMGLPALKVRFPKAKVGISRVDYEDLLVQRDWILKNLSPEEIAEWKADPAVLKMFDFDAATFGKPDFYVKGGQTYKLGKLKIRTMLTPGHSRGSICYRVENVIFSGDLLMRRDVGREDFQNGDKTALVRSVRLLYSTLPDSTIVYPGHGPQTDIGSEKRENPKVSEKASRW